MPRFTRSLPLKLKFLHYISYIYIFNFNKLNINKVIIIIKIIIVEKKEGAKKSNRKKKNIFKVTKRKNEI